MLVDIYFDQFAIVVTIWLLLLGVIFTSWFFENSKAVKMSFIPLMFAALFLTFTANKDILGSPSPNIPDKEFIYIAHQVQLINDNKYLVFWGNTKLRGSRLYIMEYSKKEEEKLKGADKQIKEGKVIKGKLVKTENKKGFNRESLELYEIKINDLFQK